MFKRSGEILRSSFMPGRGDRFTVARLGVALALSLVLHAGISVFRWVHAAPPGSDVTLVDLTVTAGPDSPSFEPEVQEPASLPVAESGQTTPSESVAESAVARERDLRADAEAQVATLEAAREGLKGRVESLTSENSDLSARLEAERERTVELERQLQEVREAERARLARVAADYDDLVSALQSEITDKVIALRQARERLTVTIVDRLLFPSGQATLTPEGRQTIARVGKVLARVGDRRILVEGHTDDVPIGPVLRERFASNWELSTARATEVVRFLTREGGVPAARLRAAGRADTEPTASNATDEGRQKNRRIEIILLPPGEQKGADEPS